MHAIVLLAAVSIFRNPFVFRESPQPVRKKPAVVRVKTVVAPPTIEPPQVSGIVPPPKPPFPWKYIGSFGPDSDRLAVLAKDRELLNVRSGDAVDGSVVRDVTPDFVEVIVEGETRRIGVGR